MSNSKLSSLNQLFKQTYSSQIKNLIPNGVSLMRIWSCKEWLDYNKITKEQRKTYPAAEQAYRIQNSKLSKVLE